MDNRAIDDGTAEPCSSSNLDGGVLGFGGGRCHCGHAESHNKEQHCLEKLHRGAVLAVISLELGFVELFVGDNCENKLLFVSSSDWLALAAIVWPWVECFSHG